MTADQLAHIARNGGGFVVDGRSFTSDNLAHIARNMTEKACIEIQNSNAFTSEQLAHVARNAAGQIIFS